MVSYTNFLSLSVFSVSEAVFGVFSVKFRVFCVFRGYFKQNQWQSIFYSDIFDHIRQETFGAKPADPMSLIPSPNHILLL